MATHSPLTALTAFTREFEEKKERPQKKRLHNLTKLMAIIHPKTKITEHRANDMQCPSDTMVGVLLYDVQTDETDVRVICCAKSTHDDDDDND